VDKIDQQNHLLITWPFLVFFHLGCHFCFWKFQCPIL
jgi:hypothetical protein